MRGMLRPVDWLCLGQPVTNKGAWSGQRLLSQNHVSFLVAPSLVSVAHSGPV